MKSLDLNKAKESLLSEFKKNLKGNLFAIILTGSASQNLYKIGWSDLDFIIVVEKLNLNVKYAISMVIQKLKKNSDIHHGYNVITRMEFFNPVIPEFSLDGKTLQALLIVRKHKERIIYFKKGASVKKIYYPKANVLKKYCLNNIGMFLLRNRQTLTRMKNITNNELKEILKKEIRASFTIVKLAVQYVTSSPQENYPDILLKAKKIFSDFDFSDLEENFKVIDSWQKINNKYKIRNILYKTDNFIENFSHYFFKVE